MAKRKVSTIPKTNGIKDTLDNDDIFLQKKHIISPKALNEIRLTEKQIELMQVIDNNDVTIITGPAGTSKTFLSCYYSLEALTLNKFDNIILTKPIQESGENLGFLPGSVGDKIEPYYESYKNNYEQIIKSVDYKKLIEKEVILYKPLSYMRGSGFSNCLDGKTKIKTKDGNIELNEIFNNMKFENKTYYVLSYNIESRTNQYQKITGIERNKNKKKIYKIIFEDDSEIILTEDHKLYDKNLNIVITNDLNVNDEIFIN